MFELEKHGYWMDLHGMQALKQTQRPLPRYQIQVLAAEDLVPRETITSTGFVFIRVSSQHRASLVYRTQQ